MKINNSTKKSLLIIALAIASTTYQTQAAPIEHIGDRYIMHIPEMELTGEESLLDVLMMCPEVISLDGNNIIGGDPFANLYGKFVIRIDNQEYGLDYATFLHHFKAREIENHQGVPERRSDEGMQQSEESHRYHAAQEGERNHRQMGTLR